MSAVYDSQRRAAKVAGLAYLLAIVPAFFAEFYVPGQLVNYDSAAETARNIMANERLFRLGAAANLLVWVVDIILIAALYVVLEPVNRGLALLAAFWRVVETATLVAAPLRDLDVVRVLGGAEYLRAFEAAELQALARLSIGAHNSAYTVGLVFFGLGSTVFCYLWLKSGYVPKALAVWGVVASCVVGACTFAFIIFPGLARVLAAEYYTAPMFFFELAMGFWLPLKGIRTPSLADESGPSPA